MRQTSLMLFTSTCLLAVVAGHCHAGDEADAAPFLQIKMIDEAGKPVEGAKVGLFVMLREFEPKTGGRWSFIHETTSDVDGVATYKQVVERFKVQPLIYARHAERQLVGSQDFIGKEFRHGLTLTMSPECHCILRLESKELEQHGRMIEKARGYVHQDPLQRFWYFAGSEPVIHAFLPTGRYLMSASSGNCCEMTIPFEIKSGTRELDLGTLDLPANPLALLEGKPAPEIRGVSAWKNSPGVTLAELRGKVVLLDFWGWWCSPCVRRAIPDLMQLHEEFNGKGLVIIGIHTPGDETDDVTSVEQLDEQLANIRKTVWGNQDLPYPVALTHFHKGRYTPRGEEHAPSLMCADYGITLWPTNVLIDRKGNVVGTFDTSKPSDRDKLKMLLEAN